MNRWGGWIAVSIAGLAACGDGQAPMDYRGEPLMSLHGVVTAAESALAEDVVPALAVVESPFLPLMYPKQHFLKGEVHGTFPSAFTLRLYDAPPSATLDALIDGEPAFTIGGITAVSSMHPAWLQTTEYEEPVPGGAISRFELCSPERCITGHPTECPEGEQDPSWDWPCGERLPEGYPWRIYGYAHQHQVVYLAGPVAAGSILSYAMAGGGALAAGYHVLELDDAPPSEEDRECQSRASSRAFEEYKRMIGDPNADRWNVDSPEANREQSKLYLLARAAEKCRSLVRVVDSAATPVRLEFTDERNYLASFSE